MTEKTFRNIMSNYSQMSEDTLVELKNLVEEYPYCQTTQILYLLNLKRLGDGAFDIRLPYAAIHVNNRGKLKSEVEKVEKILTKGKTLSKPSTQTFRGKTISELLNLQKPQENKDDKFLEQLRMEAFAKVHERLTEAHSLMGRTNFLENPERKEAAKKIMDNVIATNPKISKIDDFSDAKLKKSSHWKFKEEHSLREDFELVSETLAQLYITQGVHTKAREIYKTLSKIHPEKADHFKQLSKQIKPKSKIKTQKS